MRMGDVSKITGNKKKKKVKKQKNKKKQKKEKKKTKQNKKNPKENRHASKFVQNFIKKFDRNYNKGYMFQVDVEYLNELHELHNDLPFFPKGLSIKKYQSLVLKFVW